MRSGLQRTSQPASDSESDSECDSPQPKPAARRRTTATARGGGKVGTQPSRRKNKRSLPDADNTGQSSTKPGPYEPPPPNTDATPLPTLANYQLLGLEWGLARAEEALASLDLPKNDHPSPDGLYEAQALQSKYNLDKTMLCIALKCSRRVLDVGL